MHKETQVLNKISTGGKSLFEELFEYFEETYFSPEIPQLDNFDFGTGTLISLKTILVGLTIGLILASFITIYNKKYIGSFVRKLLAEECLDKKSAKTLAELGYLKSLGVRQAIKSDKPLSRWIKCVEEDEFYEEMERKRAEYEEAHKDNPKAAKFKEAAFKRDVATMHFYVPEDKKYTIDVKYDAKGANWVSFILVAVISIAACAFLSYTLPDMIKMIDNFITVVSK